MCPKSASGSLTPPCNEPKPIDDELSISWRIGAKNNFIDRNRETVVPAGGLNFGLLDWLPVECREAKSSHDASDEQSKIFSKNDLL